MPGIGISIHGLQRKLEIIAEAQAIAGLIPNPTLTAFAKQHGLKVSTLRSAVGEGRLTAALNASILAAADVPADEVRWLDPNVPAQMRSRDDGPDYVGRDSVSAFRSYFFRKLDLIGSDFRKAIPSQPILIDENIAYFAFDGSGQFSAPDAGISLFFSAVVDHGYDKGNVRFGFSRIRLKLMPATNVDRSNVVRRLGDLNGAGVKVVARGTAFFSEWFLIPSSGTLKGEYSFAEPICELVGADIGSTFVAELSVNTVDGGLVDSDGKALEASQISAIITAVFAENLPGKRESNGWRTLGSQIITIQRADR